MISMEGGAALSAFLDAVSFRLESFSEVILCAPFIDAATAQRLRTLAVKAQRIHCGITIITAPKGREFLTDAMAGTRRLGVLKIRVRSDLHAKAYLAIARQPGGRTEGIVTSANLTSDAFSKNLELGVRVNSHSAHGRALLAQIRYSLSQLSN